MCVVTHGEGFAYAARQDRQKKKAFSADEEKDSKY